MANAEGGTETFFKPTREQFGRVFHTAGNLEYQAFLSALIEFEVWTPVRVAAAFAQWHHESQGLKRLEESFAWRADRLFQYFPRRIESIARAQELIDRGPEAIADAVYGGRYGNRKPGDGWRYRGRGPTMLTFRDNYFEAGQALNLPLETNPDLVKMIEVGARVAGYYWHKHGCNQLADAGDFVSITKKINGGDNGLSDRQAQWKRCRYIFGLQEAA